MAWELLANNVLGSSATTINSGTIIEKKFLNVQTWYKGDAAFSIGNTTLRLGSGSIDTASNYSADYSSNFGVQSSEVNQTKIRIYDDAGSEDIGFFINLYIINNASTEKLIISLGGQATASGAGTVPAITQCYSKWANTSNQCDEIEMGLTGTGNFDTQSQLIVWGTD